jgi:NADPH-dependent 2,4-dienoyl-CoA reductase/sulfur reductase-like enzyme
MCYLCVVAIASICSYNYTRACVFKLFNSKMGEYIPDTSARHPSVIIVGAGAGGVATAARLAAAGCKVTVIEKNEFSGGRCSLIHRNEYVRSFFRREGELQIGS